MFLGVDQYELRESTLNLFEVTSRLRLQSYLIVSTSRRPQRYLHQERVKLPVSIDIRDEGVIKLNILNNLDLFFLFGFVLHVKVILGITFINHCTHGLKPRSENISEQ